MIHTGIKKLDQFFVDNKGGIIIDISGAGGTGKSHLAMQIAIDSLKQDQNVLFQDTVGGFRPERMLEMIKNQNLDPNLLEKVKVARITNTYEQKKNLSLITTNNFSLVIIDSVTDLFSFEYSKKEKLVEKNIVFMRYMHELSNIAIHNKIPIILTNTVIIIDDKEQENLEKAISMFTHVKIKLLKNNSKLICKIISPFQKQDFSYLITTQGLQIQS